MATATVIELFDHNAVIKTRDVKLDFVQPGKAVPPQRADTSRPLDLDPDSDARVYEAEHIEVNAMSNHMGLSGAIRLSILWNPGEQRESYVYSGAFLVTLTAARIGLE
jgi:hypothetical protein